MAYDTTLPRIPDPYHLGGIGMVGVSLKAIDSVEQHALNGGSRVTTTRGGSYWEIEVTYPPTLDVTTMLAFLDSMHGSATPFYIRLPQYSKPYTGYWDTSTNFKVALGDIVLVGDRELKIEQWGARGGTLSAGDMLKLSNMDKVYMVTRIEIVGDTAAITLNTTVKFPALVPLASLEVNDILFKVSIKGNSTPKPTLQTNGIYAGLSLSLREEVGSKTITDAPELSWYNKTTGMVYCTAKVRCTEEKIKCQ